MVIWFHSILSCTLRYASFYHFSPDLLIKNRNHTISLRVESFSQINKANQSQFSNFLTLQQNSTHLLPFLVKFLLNALLLLTLPWILKCHVAVEQNIDCFFRSRYHQTEIYQLYFLFYHLQSWLISCKEWYWWLNPHKIRLRHRAHWSWSNLIRRRKTKNSSLH